MSLVGPRPALPQEIASYGDLMRRRLAVTPGLTGPWQVSGRSDLPWEKTVRLDLRYVENWSFALDLQILWKTGSAVIRGARGSETPSARRTGPGGTDSLDPDSWPEFNSRVRIADMTGAYAADIVTWRYAAPMTATT